MVIMQILALILIYFSKYEKDKLELYLDAPESILKCSASATNNEDKYLVVPRALQYTFAISICLYLITQSNHVSSSAILINLSEDCSG